VVIQAGITDVGPEAENKISVMSNQKCGAEMNVDMIGDSVCELADFTFSKRATLHRLSDILNCSIVDVAEDRTDRSGTPDAACITSSLTTDKVVAIFKIHAKNVRRIGHRAQRQKRNRVDP
jgi:hypothetical protein